MRIQAVTGELSYLAPESTVLRRFTAPGESVNTGTYRTYEMPIRDGRPVRDQFTLDRNGFAIVGHTSAVTDFTNRDEVNEVYAAEVAEFVKFFTGADRVSTLGWVLRRSAAPSENASQPQAALVHDDYSVAGARGRAEADYASRFPDGPGFRRALITSLWRVFSPPPQDWPLAILDYRSVADTEGQPNLLLFVDALPDADNVPDIADPDASPAGSIFTYRPEHRWWYFPDMNAAEAVLIKLHDSDHSVAWRAPHTAFHDAGATGAHPRESVEFRTIAFFD